MNNSIIGLDISAETSSLNNNFYIKDVNEILYIIERPVENNINNNKTPATLVPINELDDECPSITVAMESLTIVAVNAGNIFKSITYGFQ